MPYLTRFAGGLDRIEREGIRSVTIAALILS